MGGRFGIGAALAAAALAAAALPAGAGATGDADLRAAVSARLPALDAAAARARPSDPSSIDRLYDAARRMEESVRRAAPVGAACRPLLDGARRLARARVRQAEGVDRLDPAAERRARALADAGRSRLGRLRRGCTGSARPAAPAVLALSPGSGEASFGALVARAPAGASAARLRIDGGAPAALEVAGGRVRTRIDAPPGAHDLELRYLRDGRVVATARAAGVRLLPAGSAAAAPGRGRDPAAAAALAELGRAAPGAAAAWVQDLRGGTAAGWNADAPFPAASTVKLGLLVAALGVVGPGDSTLREDLRAMTVWSSNLAANRVLARLPGGPVASARAAQEALARMGATSSTFTGGYIVGTELQPLLPSSPAGPAPPRVSSRVTTARDLARVLFAIHASAAGDPAARAATGLTVAEARLALGWLLASEQAGDNASLVAAGAPPGTPIAQKNGWLDDARHAAAILYTASGPRIAVLLTYRAGGMARSRAAALGARVAGVAAGM
ncbi:MAG: serine hydrolase [Thermoleophilia bacterium]